MRHTEVLNVEEQIAVRAYGRASVYREPTDHDDISPGMRPDLLIIGGAVHGGHAVAVGSTFIAEGDHQPRLRLAAQVASAEIGPRFVRAVRGLDQVGGQAADGSAL